MNARTLPEEVSEQVVTGADVVRHRIAVREGVELLGKLHKRAYRHHIVHAIEGLGYDCENYEQSYTRYPAVFLDASNIPEFIFEISNCLTQHDTQVWKSAKSAMRVDMQRGVVWFDVSTYDDGDCGGLG